MGGSLPWMLMSLQSFANTLRRICGAKLFRRARPKKFKKIQADVDLISSSTLFDAQWYLEQYPDVRAANIDPAVHYLQHGGFQSRNPGPFFSDSWYLGRNPDVRAAGINPLVHYLRHGIAEGRPKRALPTQSIEAKGFGQHNEGHRCPASGRWKALGSPKGVNFIGPIEYLNGLGTSARGYVSALTHADIPTNVLPWRIGFERLEPAKIFYPTTE